GPFREGSARSGEGRRRGESEGHGSGHSAQAHRPEHAPGRRPAQPARRSTPRPPAEERQQTRRAEKRAGRKFRDGRRAVPGIQEERTLARSPACRRPDTQVSGKGFSCYFPSPAPGRKHMKFNWSEDLAAILLGGLLLVLSLLVFVLWPQM